MKQKGVDVFLCAMVALLIATVVILLVLSIANKTVPGQPGTSNNSASGAPTLPKFTSGEDLLEAFKNASQNRSLGWTGYVVDSLGSGFASPMPAPVPTTAPIAASGKEYSTTNVQVEGVDEADTVKTDGEYVYMIA
jgi:inhibitor of cysteine peptidase